MDASATSQISAVSIGWPDPGDSVAGSAVASLTARTVMTRRFRQSLIQSPGADPATRSAQFKQTIFDLDKGKTSLHDTAGPSPWL